MKHKHYKNWILASIILSVVLSFPVFAESDSALDPIIEGGVSPAKCIAKGNLDFDLFLNSVINFDGIKEGLESINDIIARNQCQSFDVLSLINQRDKVRGAIRDAFLTCNTERIPVYEKRYYELTAEIYYARNVVDGAIVLSLPFDILTSRTVEDEEALFYPREKLYEEMYSKYVVSETMSKQEFEVLFSKLENKYKERKKSYVICEHSSWDGVKDKWEEFIDTWGGTAPAWDRLERAVIDSADRIVTTATETGFADYITGLIQLNLNNLEPQAEFTEILNRLNEVLPSGDAVTQDMLLKAVTASEKTYSTAEMKEKMKSQFEALYRDGSDASIKIFVLELSSLNNVIEDTFIPIEKVESCTSTMNSRQCPGN